MGSGLSTLAGRGETEWARKILAASNGQSITAISQRGQHQSNLALGDGANRSAMLVANVMRERGATTFVAGSGSS